MNILILGSGGREHSLAWAVAQNPKCDRLMVAPGNAGIAKIADCVDLNIVDCAAVLAFVRSQAIDFVIIGPEAPLAAGVTDVLRAADVLCFGPSQAAAQLEASKFFTKSICDAAGAPTAGYGHFTDQPSAADYVRNMGAPIVSRSRLSSTSSKRFAVPLAAALSVVLPSDDLLMLALSFPDMEILG